jgi:hypothetical protein
MKKASDKADFRSRKVPAALEDLPRFAFTPSRAPASREQSGRSDIAFNIRTPTDLIDAMKGGFANPASSRTMKK